MTTSLHIQSNGAESTQELGRTIGEQISAGDVILL